MMLRSRDTSESMAGSGHCSPVSTLSSSLQQLQCRDGKCRKIDLTPECINPPLNSLSRDRETPTVCAVGRRRARSLSPESSSNTCVQQDWEVEGVPAEGASLPREVLDRLRRMTSWRQAPPTRVTCDDVADLTLIGDFSKQHLLPVERAGHRELQCVSAQTVASLIRGQFGPAVDDFLIIDCRYPYEYQGGHIKDAVNLHTESQIQQAVPRAAALSPCGSSRRLWDPRADHPSDSLPEDEGSSPRKLIVFHCEFSSERGPYLCQYLRRLDRCVNAQVYPVLHYPELYLLLGGYKHFHASYPDLCDPCGYVPMRQLEYREQLQGFRRKRPSRQRRRRPIRTQQTTTR